MPTTERATFYIPVPDDMFRPALYASVYKPHAFKNDPHSCPLYSISIEAKHVKAAYPDLNLLENVRIRPRKNKAGIYEGEFVNISSRFPPEVFVIRALKEAPDKIDLLVQELQRLDARNRPRDEVFKRPFLLIGISLYEYNYDGGGTGFSFEEIGVHI